MKTVKLWVQVFNDIRIKKSQAGTSIWDQSNEKGLEYCTGNFISHTTYILMY